MNTIYEQHDVAFNLVSAYVICKNGERVATIAFKFPKDGAGRLWCYLHWIGIEMVRDYAGGYGYDKRSAVVEAAVDKLNHCSVSPIEQSDFIHFVKSLTNIGGKDWSDALRDAGFTVLQAV